MKTAKEIWRRGLSEIAAAAAKTENRTGACEKTLAGAQRGGGGWLAAWRVMYIQ